MKFQDFPLAPEIQKSLAQMGFRRATDIQYKAIPSIMAGEDVLAIAQTGTGKTAAFAIPIISQLHARKRSRRSTGIRALVMVPTHELALQVTDVFKQIARHTKVQIGHIIGGVDQDPQIARLEKGLDILVATPGRVFDLHHQRYLDLRQIEMLVLDEADHMLVLGFYKDIQDLLRLLPRERQTLFFSATINPKVKRLAYSLVRDAIRIQISPKDPVSRNVEHAVTMIEMDDKRFFLERALTDHPESKVLVFVRTKVRAERVRKAMARVGIDTETLHSDKDQETRVKVWDQFKKGQVRVLIATDVTARGIDIPGVDFVINYDLPDQSENYVHRVGRTGRGSQKGQALSFCSPQEKPILKEIEEFLGHSITRLKIDPRDYSATLETPQTPENDWRSLLGEIEELEEKSRKKQKRKKK